MTDPIELLQERLNEIDDINCTDQDFIDHRNKFYVSIELLKTHGFYQNTNNRRKLTDYDVKFIEDYCNIGELEYFASLFNVHKTTIEKVIGNRRRKMKKLLKQKRYGN